tara:strand:- start:1118 stop:1405 length:288 start_codon:yes stop_codon:yes gene_type:complete
MNIHHSAKVAVEPAHHNKFSYLTISLSVFDAEGTFNLDTREEEFKATTILSIDSGLSELQAHIDSDDLGEIASLFRKAHNAHKRAETRRALDSVK